MDNIMDNNLTHFNASGEAHMVDVEQKKLQHVKRQLKVAFIWKQKP